MVMKSSRDLVLRKQNGVMVPGVTFYDPQEPGEQSGIVVNTAQGSDLNQLVVYYPDLKAYRAKFFYHLFFSVVPSPPCFVSTPLLPDGTRVVLDDQVLVVTRLPYEFGIYGLEPGYVLCNRLVTWPKPYSESGLKHSLSCGDIRLA